MKLTQGLLPASKVSDGPDNSITSHPDENGGFELGTWTIKRPWDCLGKLEFNTRSIGECGYGVQCCHKFTPEQCQKIIEYLKTFKRVEKVDETKENGVVVETETRVGYVSPVGNGTNYLEEWYNRLITLFSNVDDPPVYYWAD